MKLYYHKTNKGAEYYCLTHLEGCEEGDFKTAIMRTDIKNMNCDGIEVYLPSFAQNDIAFIQRYCTPEKV